MNDDKKYLALLKLLGPIKCTCGEKLIIQEVVDSNDQYLLLRALEKCHLGDKGKYYEDFYVIYNIKSKKVVKSGTFNRDKIKVFWHTEKRK